MDEYTARWEEMGEVEVRKLVASGRAQGAKLISANLWLLEKDFARQVRDAQIREETLALADKAHLLAKKAFWVSVGAIAVSALVPALILVIG